ncbi:TIR domain-containing protein [Cyanobacteria bacterium FACHB-471]|nr:TIR domain-containing protein [Cyanobacteria bacterium FACHB-471]
MTDIFISYSRKDKVFTQLLHAALEATGREAWIDWQDIPLTADWWQEIKRGIEGANTFVFIISPDSITSSVCRREVEHAVLHNKRLVPIVHREELNQALLHPALASHNWLFFRENDDFDTAFQALIKAIDTDLEHLHTHTQILVRTLEWEDKGRNDSFLLRGSNLKDAEQWLQQSANKDPQPTEQQKNYISKSREAEDFSERIAQANETAKRRLRIATLVMGIALVTLAAATVVTVQAFQQQLHTKIVNRLEQETDDALEQFDSSQLDGLLKAIKAGRYLQSMVENRSVEQYPTLSPVLALQTILQNIQEQNRIPAHPGEVNGISFNPNGGQIATAGEDGVTRIWSLTGEKLAEIAGHPDEVSNISFSPDGMQLAIAGENGMLQLWDLAEQQLVALRIYPTGLTDVSFSPGGRQVATAGEDGIVRLWSFSGQSRQFQGHTGEVSSISFSPDGTQIASSGRDDTIRLWDLSGKPPVEFRGDGSEFSSVDFHSDGTQLAAAGEDGTVWLWNISGEKIGEFKAHPVEVTSIQFSSDGTQLATAGEDGRIKLWDLSGQQLAKFIGHQSGVNVVRFSPDGKQLATAGEDGTVRLWDSSRQASGLEVEQEELSVISRANESVMGNQDDSVRSLSNTDLTTFLQQGCDWLKDYLNTNPAIDESDRQLCGRD